MMSDIDEALEALERFFLYDSRRTAIRSENHVSPELDHEVTRQAIDELQLYRQAFGHPGLCGLEQQRGSEERAPWHNLLLSEWSIVGMNHYHVNGERFLFVALCKDGYCIKEEGRDDKYLWNRLWHKANESPAAPTPEDSDGLS